MDIETLELLEKELYHTIMDNILENGMEIARYEYKKFINTLVYEKYEAWVIDYIKDKNKRTIQFLNI